MKTKILLAISLILSVGLLSAYDLYGAFQIKTSPRDADVNLVDIDLYLCSTPSPVYPVFMDEYMELWQGIPGRSIRVIITKEGYIPVEKTLFIPFLYADQRDAMRYPTVFNFRLVRDRMQTYYEINNYYAYNYYRPRPIHYYYYPGYYWYPAPSSGYLPYPPGYVHPRPPSGGHPGTPGSGGINPPGPPGGYPGSHGGGGQGSSGSSGGYTPPGGGSHGSGGQGGGSGYTPPNPPGSGSGSGGHSTPPGGGGYGGSHGNGGYTPPSPPNGGGYTPPGSGSGYTAPTPPNGGASKPSTPPSDGKIEKAKPNNVPDEDSKPRGKEKSESPLEVLRLSNGRDRK